MNKKTLLSSTILLGATLVISGCGQTASAPKTSPSLTAQSSNGQAVAIANFAFTPATLTIKVGDTVTWTNNDAMAHTVTSTAFGSSSIAPGASFQHTFDKAGTYDYHCSIHPSMTGQIIAQ